MRKFLLASTLLAASLLAGCSDAVGADRAVRAQGLSDIQITGYRWFGCGEKDDTSTGFTARNIRGEQVTGVVCSNWSPFGKTSTVRFD